MAVTLVPYPPASSVMGRATARTCIREAVDVDLTDSRIDALAQMASDLIQNYAPDAPQSLKNEGALRIIGRAVEQPGASRREQRIGEISAAYAPSLTGMLHHAGVKSLLSPWRQRRAGVAR